ncbi:hypothetical protein SAMN06265222_117118 [Neorhodopirellula lusitana]|uniref:Uncharacterized protein n=1 Tax=Neorhodopirellula lusitana TaxID=445327 RepID=A0ABY1QNH2_9BACT|nr:hypothetical protein SAMN06265222_117118 [Neorhodopirellula lusitana]
MIDGLVRLPGDGARAVLSPGKLFGERVASLPKKIRGARGLASRIWVAFPRLEKAGQLQACFRSEKLVQLGGVFAASAAAFSEAA